VVDALDDVAALVAIVLEAGSKGVVDESVAEGTTLDEGSFDAKGAADVFEAHGRGDLRVQSPESRVQSPESRVQSPESRVQSSEFRERERERGEF
jgi:hypothetical protein